MANALMNKWVSLSCAAVASLFCVGALADPYRGSTNDTAAGQETQKTTEQSSQASTTGASDLKPPDSDMRGTGGSGSVNDMSNPGALDLNIPRKAKDVNGTTGAGNMDSTDRSVNVPPPTPSKVP